MNIRYKLIEHERMGDAPFCGALISSIDCKFNCRDCFNQGVKELPTKVDSASNIIDMVLSNTFNKGVILAGLEWTLQMDEAIEIAKLAKIRGLKTMLYTGNPFDVAVKKYDLSTFDYVKCGQYNNQQKSANHIEFGVVLASENQHIYKSGVDYNKKDD